MSGAGSASGSFSTWTARLSCPIQRRPPSSIAALISSKVPANIFGGVIASEAYAGARNPEGKGTIANITPSKDGIGDWSGADIIDFLENGNLPDGDVVGGSMAAVQGNMAKLTPQDRGAIATYLAVPAVHRFVAPLVYAVPVQLIAYYTAVFMGTDVDQPRNLAKSVTVE